MLLIAHTGCAFYGARLGLDGDSMGDAQVGLLANAAALIARATGVRAIGAFTARPRSDGFDVEERSVGPGT